MTNPTTDVAREATAWQNAKAQYPETTRDAITRIELGDRAADAAVATPRGLAEQIAALTAHLTTTPIPAPDRAAVLRQIAEIQQHLFDVLVALTLAVADEHGSTADDVVAAADEAGCLAGHSRDACHDAAQAAEDLIAAHLAQNGDTR